jgi:hypothetical protein
MKIKGSKIKATHSTQNMEPTTKLPPQATYDKIMKVRTQIYLASQNYVCYHREYMNH